MHLAELIVRAAVGAAVAVVVSLAGRRSQTLSGSGAAVGAAMGTIAMAAGWSWGALLLSLFISVSLLSRIRAVEKTQKVGGVVEKGGERDAAQIVANGAVFTTAALGSLIAPAPLWYAIAAGALSFSAADTWATEIGTLTRSDPYLITSGRRVPAGTSGGISLLGSFAAFGGALFIGAGTMFAAWPVSLVATLLGGIIGAFADSVIGATLQSRRWCGECRKPTERVIHDCGTRTTINGGIVWLNNDAVNTVCSAIGALVALLIS